MARTNRTPKNARRSEFRTEKKVVRHPHYRNYRHLSNHLTRIGRWEDILDYCRTSGWLTW